MDANEILEQVTQTLSNVFRKGSRFQTEKTIVVVSYVVIVVASLFWGFSGSNAGNALGAKFGHDSIAHIDQQIFFVQNTSSDDWTHVRIALNEKYLYKVKKIAAGQRVTLRPSNFSYYFYIPRPWGRQAWERLAKTPKPSHSAPADVVPKLVQIHADQGFLNLHLKGK